MADTVELAETISELLYGIVGWILVGFGLWFGLMAGDTVVEAVTLDGVAIGTGLLAALSLAVSLAVVAFGVFVNPRMRRRLNRRHAPSEFGRVRTVDQRVIRTDEGCTERCVACGSRIERGLVRRYREEYAIAGVPVYTRSEGHNHYCVECATVGGDVPDGSPSTADDAATDRDASLAEDWSLERR